MYTILTCHETKRVCRVRVVGSTVHAGCLECESLAQRCVPAVVCESLAQRCVPAVLSVSRRLSGACRLSRASLWLSGACRRSCECRWLSGACRLSCASRWLSGACRPSCASRWLSGACRLQGLAQTRYMPGYMLARSLGLSSLLVARITGCIMVTRDDAPSRGSKINVGLNLKLNKKREQVGDGGRRETGRETL